MNTIAVSGPGFEISSDRAIVALGHSERREVGQYWGEVLDRMGIFSSVEIVTSNRLDAKKGRQAIKDLFKHSVAITHSAGVMRVPESLQIVAFNPVEPLSIVEALIRADFVTKDKIEKEDGSHKTGFSDLAKAAIELASSPLTTIDTILRLNNGYSATEDLIRRREIGDFPEGVAMVHSLEDVFGFPSILKMRQAAENGITNVIIDGHKHNEILFAPKRTVDLLTPVIFPAVSR